MITATITSKGQITLPKAVRERLKLRTGDRVAFAVNSEDEAVMKPVTRSVEQVFGILYKKGQKTASVEEMDQAIKKRMKGMLA